MHHGMLLAMCSSHLTSPLQMWGQDFQGFGINNSLCGFFAMSRAWHWQPCCPAEASTWHCKYA